MTIEEGCLSLKLECALRDLGFVEIHYRVIAHAGFFFVSPVGFISKPSLQDDLVGFQVSNEVITEGLRADLKIISTAKKALDFALSLS